MILKLCDSHSRYKFVAIYILFKNMHSMNTVNSTYPEADQPEQLGPSGKFFKNSTKLTCLEITGNKIKYSTVVWFLVLQIWCGQKVQLQVHTVNSNSRTSNCQCSLFSKINPIIWILCKSGWLAPQLIQASGVLLHKFKSRSLC